MVTMQRNSTYITRIADSILRTAEGDYKYIHDPDHRNRPHGTFWPTSKGWSNNPEDNPKNKQNVPRGTNQEDSSYFEAVKRGDMETVGRMVNERAMEAGYLAGPVYHGTNSEFTVFDREKSGGDNFWFTDKESDIESGEAGASGRSRIVSGYLNLGKIAGWDEYEAKMQDQLIQEGYNSVVLPNDNGNNFIVFQPNQIKSADPIVKDDAGNIIPLSQRFNHKSNDIRY
jgi:hypothetical protein